MRPFDSQASTNAASAIVPTRFVGRQPILDLNREIYGYEMLFRAGPTNGFSGDGEEASRDVIDHCLLLLPSSDRELVFINCTRSVLIADVVTLLPPAGTVLEILENIEPDVELLETCRQLRKKGYRFALDDFSPETSKLAFLEIADFIKIDFRASDAKQRHEIYAMSAGTKATLLAEKVETEMDVRQAITEGCTLLQGYFFSKPVLITTRVIPQNHAIYLRLLAALTRTPSDIRELESLVMADASLCYRLLRLVNSAIYALPSPISSIRNALLLVGDDEFRKMLTIAVAGIMGTTRSKGVVRMALERARFCELLAPLMNESPSKLYLLGLLSLIDVILEIPMTQIMSSLPVNAEIKSVLLGHNTPLSVVLDFVRCHESGNWQKHADIQRALGLHEDQAAMIYVDALRWVREANQALGT